MNRQIRRAKAALEKKYRRAFSDAEVLAILADGAKSRGAGKKRR